jgi:hypothetical protein
MRFYYVSRALIAIVMAALMASNGLVWWGALLTGLLIFAAFVLLARSGRFLVQPEKGLTAMRRDERTTEINRRAGLHGFVAMGLGIGGLVFYYGSVAPGSVPVKVLLAVLGLGLAAYYLTDFWLRRA